MLSPSEQEDIRESLLDYGTEFLNLNAIHMAKDWFYKEFQDEMFRYVRIEGIQQNWYHDVISVDALRNSDDDSTQSNTTDDADDVWRDFVENVCQQMYEMLEIPDRQQLHTFNVEEYSETDIKLIDDVIKTINSAPVQKQRSEEWYDIRHNLFSASNIYKLFGSSALFNSLVYEKCKPPAIHHGGINSDTRNPMNWGIKYEPLSLMIYEEKYNTRVKSDYGCIPHKNPRYHIGASPDAINIDPTNTFKYGTLVEVKNPVNRNIDGVPSEAYWVQMQMQMEVCDLMFCDFLETRFKEFESEQAYLESDHKYKGIICFMIPRNGEHVESRYEYIPYNLSKDDQEKYMNDLVVQNPQFHLYEKSYWYLDEFSCILVKRNAKWFESTTPIITSAWTVVEKERIEGFEHRAPKKAIPKNRLVIDIPESAIGDSNEGSTQDKEHVHNMNIVPNNVCLVKLDENGDLIQ